MNNKLEGRVNKEYYKERLKDFVIGLITLAMLGSFIGVSRISKRSQERESFSHDLKQATYFCVENSQRNYEIEESLKFDKTIKENNYNNLNKITEERQQLESIINKDLLVKSYILPKELTTNNFYKEKMIEIVHSELEKYNPKLAPKSSYFVNECLDTR